MINVKNPSNVDVKDYPFNFGTYSIGSGKTVALEDKVANYLLKTYGFLEKAENIKVSDVIEKKEVKKEVKKENLDDLIKEVQDKTGNKVVGKYRKDKKWLENKLK